MRHLMIPVCVLLALSAAAAAESFTPADAQIVVTDARGDRTIPARVVTERLDGIQYELGDAATGTVKAEQVVEINYAQVNERDYLRGKNRYESRRWDEAVESLTNAANNSRYEHVRVQSLEWLAEAYVHLDQFAEASAALERIVTDFPAHLRLPDVIYRRGEILIEAEDLAAAERVFTDLAGRATAIGRMSKPFGELASGLAVLGRANVAAARGDNGQVINLLSDLLDDLDPAAAPTRYGAAAMRYAAALAASGRGDEAMTAYSQLAYQPVDSSVQAAAHLERAKLLQANGDTLAAFDAAVTAAVRRNRGDATLRDARALARELAAIITADGALSNEEKREYREYLSRL